MAASDVSQIKAANLFNVDGIVAVITGGGSGLGAYMARALAVNGASKVYILGRREEALKKTANSVDTNNIVPLVGDVVDKPSLQKCAEMIKQQTGHVDVLICNSGISGPAVPFKDPKTQQTLPVQDLADNMWNVEPDDVTSTYHVNVTGVHFTIAAFLPLLDEANKKRPRQTTANDLKPRPQIITTGSIGGLSRRPLSNFSYGPSKAAVMHMTKMLSSTLVPHDIRVNTIAPGLYFSEMTEGEFEKVGVMDKHNIEGTWPKDLIPATRSGDERDMAGVILFMCSRAGAYLNGHVVLTDGGRLNVVPASY